MKSSAAQELAVLGFGEIARTLDRGSRWPRRIARCSLTLICAMRVGVLVRDRQRVIRAAVVDDRVVPTLVRLGHDALDAGPQVLCAIEDGRHHAHERRGLVRERSVPSWRAHPVAGFGWGCGPVWQGSQPPREVRDQRASTRRLGQLGGRSPGRLRRRRARPPSSTVPPPDRAGPIRSASQPHVPTRSRAPPGWPDDCRS